MANIHVVENTAHHRSQDRCQVDVGCLNCHTALSLDKLKERNFPKEQGFNVLIIHKTSTDQGSSVSQQLLKVHELNPLICSLNRTEVTRGSLANEKNLTILSSRSLDEAFFLKLSAFALNFPEEVSRRFPALLKG